jgi:hypothetical protein
MWSFSIEVIAFQIGTLFFCITTWVLYPHWLKNTLIKNRQAANTILWSFLFLGIVIPAENGVFTALIVSTTTVIFTNLFLKLSEQKQIQQDKQFKDSVIQYKPRIRKI